MRRHVLTRIALNNGSNKWAVLCFKCQHLVWPFEEISWSELPCDICGVKFIPPPGGNMFVKDRKHTITASYPDIETARQNVADSV